MFTLPGAPGQRFKNRFCHWPAIGWLAWDGRRWTAEGADGLVVIAEHETVRAIQAEANAIRDADEDVVVGVKRNNAPVMLSERIAAWGRTSVRP